MKKILSVFGSALVTSTALKAGPAFAAGGPFFSLHNTNFVVLIAFLVFVGILLWAGAPAKIGAMLDARATQIKADLDSARALRDEAKAVLAAFDVKQREVEAQSARIVDAAKKEAQSAAAAAKAELKASIGRKMTAAAEQIASAEAAALRNVRERAVTLAVGAAAEVLAKQATAESQSASIDASIEQVAANLH